jgi:hypothetical protein
MERDLTELDLRRKAGAIVRLFRARQPIDILPTDLMPARLDKPGIAELGAV